MSQPSSESGEAPRGVIVQKPKTNIYTIMLIISLLAMIMACIFLWLEIGEYGGYGAA
ncbi:MAG: hypothetical protein AAGB00_09995 [Planctomycetota bacterium]